MLDNRRGYDLRTVGHHLIALLVGKTCEVSVARAYDLFAVQLTPSLTMFHIDHYFSAYWEAKLNHRGQPPLDRPPGAPGIFPNESVLRRQAAAITNSEQPRFAIIMTEYFGGIGGQWAALYEGERRISADNASINDVLRAFGVERTPPLDEFDTIGLGKHRSPSEHLEKYVAFCDELGV